MKMKNVRLKNETRTELALHLTPSLLLSLKVLQLPILSLETLIEAEVEENPALEPVERELEEGEFRGDITSYFAEFFPHISDEEEEKNYEEIIGVQKQPDLYEHVLKQINEKFDDDRRRIAMIILDAMDDYGFLTVDVGQLVKTAKVDMEEFLQVLEEFRRLDPPGIGTYSIKESLLVQLEVKGFGRNSLEYRLIEECYDELLKQKFGYIREKFNLSPEDFKRVMENVRSLNPKPGLLYSQDRVFYVYPDIIVKFYEYGFEVEVNETPLRPIRLSPLFLKILENPKDYSKEIVKFAREKAKRAWALIESLHRRRTFLKELGEYVVKRNIGFFRGESKDINTSSIKEAAEFLNRSSSTVSRAVNNKYIEGPCGIYRLSDFFEKKLENQVSKNKIERALKEIIENEDRRDPFTDEEIAIILEKKGFGKLSRRTVTKYRNKLGIPSARDRKGG